MANNTMPLLPDEDEQQRGQQACGALRQMPISLKLEDMVQALTGKIDEKHMGNDRYRKISNYKKGYSAHVTELDDGGIEFVRTTGKETVSMVINDKSVLSKRGNADAQKMLFFLASKVTTKYRKYDKNSFVERITFSFSELVEAGMYSSISAAFTGYLSGMKKLQEIKIKFTIYDENGEEDYADYFFLFPRFTISRKHGEASVGLAPFDCWADVWEQVIGVPGYFSGLSVGAMRVLYFIMARMRQSFDKNNPGKPVPIRLENLQYRLGLPDVDAGDSPGKTIKKPLEDAFEEIMQADGGRFLDIEKHYSGSVRNMLAEGSIIVSPRGEMLKYLGNCAKLMNGGEVARKGRGRGRRSQ